MKKKIDKIKKLGGKRKEEWASVLLDNIIHIVKVIQNSTAKNKEQIWDRITIGSDFDGMINPLNAFSTAGRFDELTKTWNKLLRKLPYNNYLMGFTADQVLDKICYQNVYDFVIKHYN